MCGHRFPALRADGGVGRAIDYYFHTGDTSVRTSWGCKLEPPQIPSENISGVISGLQSHPTLLFAYSSPDLGLYLRLYTTRVGKHLFPDNMNKRIDAVNGLIYD